MLRVHSLQWWCIFYFLLASPNTGPCPASPESLDTHSFQDPHNCVVILPQVISPPPSFFQRCGLVAVSLVKVTPTEASATSTFLNCYTTSKCFRQCSQTWHFGSASAKLDQLLLLTQPPPPEPLVSSSSKTYSSWSPHGTAPGEETMQSLPLSSEVGRLLLNLCHLICHVLSVAFQSSDSLVRFYHGVPRVKSCQGLPTLASITDV